MTDPVDAGANAPHCPSCGYPLLGLTEHRCPECGEAFDPDYASIIAYLLPWERPETGSALRRLFRTLILASFHPARFFENVRCRKEKRVAHAGRLLAAFLLMSFGFLGAEYLADKMIFFTQLVVKHHRPATAFDYTVGLVGVDWLQQPISWLLEVSWSAFTVLALVAFIKRLFPGKFGSLYWIDVVAVYSPVVAMLAFLSACSELIAMMFQGAIESVVEVTSWVQVALLLFFHWFACRRLLQLSRWTSGLMLIVGWVVQYGCGYAVYGTYWLIWFS